MGKVAEEAVLFSLVLVQAAAQPVQSLAQRLQVLRAAHLDRAREVGVAELADRRVELRYRTRDVARQRQSNAEHHGSAENHQQDELALYRLRVGAQAHHLPVRHQVADRQHLVGRLGELPGHAADAARVELAARRLGQQIVEALLPRHGLLQRVQLAFLERQQQQLVRNLLEAEVRAGVVVGQPRVPHHRHLLRDALDRADAVHQGAARARRLRGVEDRLAALLGEPLGMPGRVGQRAHKRRRDQREAGQQQPKK